MIPDRLPETAQVVGGPTGQLVVRAEPQPTLLLEPIEVAADPRRGTDVGRGRPQDRRVSHGPIMPRAAILPGPMPATRVVSVRVAVLGLVVAAVISLLPANVLGASAIPADQTGQILDGTPITAIVGDVDGDGVRELITLRPRDDDPVHLAVEVLEAGRDGTVRSAGSAPLARVASVTEQLSGLPRPDENNLLQARVDEPARLIAWHKDGREHVLAVAIGTLRNARACCLSIWAVERDGDGIELRLMTDTMRSADQVWAVDMDGDGTDELLTTEPRQDADPNILPIAVLRWTGERHEDHPARLGVLGGRPLSPLGNSDGRSEVHTSELQTLKHLV